MHLDTGFCNLSSAATEWHGTTQNMSFRPEIVDWLRQNKNGFGGINSCIKCTPIQIVATGRVGQPNGMKTIQNMSFRPKVVDWACLLQKKQETVLEA